MTRCTDCSYGEGGGPRSIWSFRVYCTACAKRLGKPVWDVRTEGWKVYAPGETVSVLVEVKR